MLLNKIPRIKNFPWYCLFASSIISTIHLDRICFANTQKNEEIKYVLPRDAIPAIKNPEFVPSTKAELDDREPVIGVTVQGKSRAYSGIGHKHLTTIYPPLTLMMFAVAELFSHSFVSMKIVFLTFDVLSIFLLVKFLRMMGKEPVHVLIYAWSPLVLISFAARGHCDSLQIFFVILALYLYSMKKQIKSFISISLATMSKFVSIIIVPFLIPRRKFKYLIILFLVILLLYSPYSNAGRGLFSTFFHFGTHYHYNDSVHFLIFCLSLGSPFISKIITIIIFCSVIFCFYKKHLQKNPIETTLDTDPTIIKYSYMSIGTFLILAPTLHPWYLTWIVPFLCFNKNWAWLTLTGTVVCYYFMNHALFSKMILYNNEWVWQEVHWLKLPEYLPFYFLLLYGFLRKHLLTDEYVTI